MTILLMPLTLVLAAAVIFDAVCVGGTDGMTSLCPIISMLEQSPNAGSDLHGAITQHKLCLCPGQSNITSGQCTAGWALDPRFHQFCNDFSGGVSGGMHVIIGCIVLLAAVVGMFGMSIRSRTRMATMVNIYKVEQGV